MADRNCCPNCGAERPADAPERPCPVCLIQEDPREPSAVPATSDVVAGPHAAPEQQGPEATSAQPSRPAPAGPTGEWSDVPSGPTQSSSHRGATASLPYGATVHYFGDYEIRRELGRGGMGVVYEARQVSLNRPVALKLIKSGLLASDDDMRRFQNEAEAVALLDHPGIVSAFEVGEQDGQRYLSMQLVRGEGLVNLLDQYKHDPRTAAGLMAEVAEAVAHAHQRGILHRDLKPANILIDAEGKPHVTDFGLAKRVEGDVELTQSGAILGTPAYMSPEQATGRRGSITTSTDVYGLGAILYALLSGKAPFGGDSVIDTLNAVRCLSPEPPRNLNDHVPRDLETICLKCLEKDPRRRYASAHELAVDLNNWLESRPIHARRVGLAERAWLWCTRKPAVAALALAVLFALVGGTAAVIAVQARANRALGMKNAALTESLQREAQANQRVQQRYDLAMDAIKTFHTGVGEDFLLKEPQFRGLRDRLLNAAAGFYDRLNGVLATSADAASRRALFDSNFALAELTEKVGRRDDALALHRRVLAGREALANEPAADYRVRLQVGTSLLSVIALVKQTKPTEVWPLLSQAVALHEELAAAHPDDPEVQNALAKVLIQLGDHRKNVDRQRDEAERLFRRTLAIWKALERSHPEEPDYRYLQGLPLIYLSYLRADEGKLDETIQLYQQALDLARERLDKEPSNVRLRASLAEKQSQMSLWYYSLDQTDRAVDLGRAALESWRKIAADQPAVASHQRSLAGAHSALASVLVETVRFSEAEKELRSALAIHQALAEANPDNGNRGGVAAIRLELGKLLFRAGRFAEGETELRAAIAFRQAAADAEPTLISSRMILAENHRLLAGMLSGSPRLSQAEAEYRSAISLLQSLADEVSINARFRESLAKSHNELGYCLAHGTNRWKEAEDEHRAALAIAQELAEKNPAMTDYRFLLAMTHHGLGKVLGMSDRPVEAEAEYRASLALLEKLAAGSPDVWRFRNMMAVGMDGLSDTLRSRGRAEEARDGYERALQLLERPEGIKAPKANPQDHSGYTLRRRGLARRDLGDLAGAADDTRRALALYEGGRPQRAEEWFELACCHALLADLAGRGDSGVATSEASSRAESAMALLSRAAGMGYRGSSPYRRESALDPLRRRDDFRLLMMDLAMPTDPFAR